MSIKPERNDPCPCGSGKIFEKCCQEWYEAKFSVKKVAASTSELETKTLLAPDSFNNKTGSAMNPSIFLNAILRNFLAKIHNVEKDNYDTRRFSHKGVDLSEYFDLGSHADYMTLFVEQYEAFFATWQLLCDDISRERFIRLILYRLLGHLHMRINDEVTASGERSLFEKVAGLQTGISTLPRIFGPLLHFEDIEFDSHRLRADCGPGNVMYTFFKRQYYFERLGIRIQPEQGDTVIDGGACLGDTAVAFAARVGKKGRVFSFDPLPTHVAVSQHNIEQNAFGDRASVIPLAIGNATKNTNQRISQYQSVAPGFCIIGKEELIPMTTIDDFVKAEKPGRVNFIKMDIEGAELAALHGAADTLVRDQPKVAVSLYHLPVDFITIPQFLASLLPDYDFHLEHYTIHKEETVLYGSPRRCQR